MLCDRHALKWVAIALGFMMVGCGDDPSSPTVEYLSVEITLRDGACEEPCPRFYEGVWGLWGLEVVPGKDFVVQDSEVTYFVDNEEKTEELVAWHADLLRDEEENPIVVLIQMRTWSLPPEATDVRVTIWYDWVEPEP